MVIKNTPKIDSNRTLTSYGFPFKCPLHKKPSFTILANTRHIIILTNFIVSSYYIMH